MKLSFDEAGAFLDDTADGFPQALFEGLNGGVNLLADTVPDPEFPPGEMYILGEYCEDLLGRYINLYYGSFAALAEREDWDRAAWEAELRDTLWSPGAASTAWTTGTRRSWRPGEKSFGTIHKWSAIQENDIHFVQDARISPHNLH